MDTDKNLNSCVVVINPGSSSLKWAAFSSLDSSVYQEKGTWKLDPAESFLEKFFSSKKISTCIIRFVHGGPDFFKPSYITQEILNKFEKLNELAYLHNKTSFSLAKRLLKINKNLTVIAVFDTEFFHTLPKVSQQVPLPKNLVEKYSLRRYGFHGFAHSALTKAYKNNLCENKNLSKIITMQLGSGCSMAAIKDGLPIETTMSFSPNDGLLMRTRTGELDPGLLLWLQKKENWSLDQAESNINRSSGWEGISGIKKDFSELDLSDDIYAINAVELFVNRVRKTLGAYVALIGGLDAVRLSGGVCEQNVYFGC